MKDVWHEVLRDKHESFKWSLLIDAAIETVRKHKQDYLLSKYGVAEPSQRQPVRNKKEDTKMNKEEINKLTAKIESCWDENNPGDVRSFDERLKEKLTLEEYELLFSVMSY